MPESIANSVNDPTTTLNGSITNVATSIVVTSASEMPSAGSFRILIWDGASDSTKEIVKIASRSGNTLTVDTRAAEGPYAAQSHASGEKVELVLTKAALEDYLSQREALFNYMIAR